MAPTLPPRRSGETYHESDMMSRGVISGSGLDKGETSSADRLFSHSKLPIRPIRPLLVNEALQFTPLTSILPHNADVLGLPNADVSVSHPIFSTSSEKQRARDHIIHLNQQIRHGEDTQIRETLGTMQSLLDPGMISQFTFKHAPSSHTSSDHVRPTNELSPFAKLVLEHTAVEYLYTQPATPSSLESETPRQNSVPEPTPQQPTTPITPDLVAENDVKFSQKNQNGGLIPKRDLVEQQPLHDIQIHESIDLASKRLAAEEPKAGERKRKRQAEENDLDDIQAAANADLQELTEMIWEIQEAQDNFSSNGVNTTGGLLTSIHCADGDMVTLDTTAHARLEGVLARVIKSKRFQQLSVEQLSNLQQLSLGGIIAADGIDASFSSEWSESDAENWQADVEILERAFRASRTVLRIMSGKREEKILYPEEMLQRIISLVCKVIDDCITRVIEARSTGESVGIFRIAMDNKKTIAHLLQSSGKVLKLLLDVITKEELSEKPINDILFFAIRVLFVENSTSEKDSVLGIQKFEVFRRTAMDITSKIYSRYEGQRNFILGEILDSLQKLPTTKVHGRQFKLPDGGKLQLTSVLLLRLVSTSGSGGISVVKHQSLRVLPDLDNPEDPVGRDVEDSDASENGADSDDDMPLVKATSDRLSSIDRNRPLAKSLFKAGFDAAQKIIYYLTKRASSCSKTGEQPHRHLLDMFVEDLITVFNMPEWPASEILLRVLVLRMIELSENSGTVSAKNMALETLGIMGTTILGTTSHAKQLSRALESDDSQLSDKLINSLETSTSEGLTRWELAGPDGPYHIILEHLSMDDSDVQGFLLTQWMKLMFWGLSNITQPYELIEEFQTPFATKVCDAFSDSKWDPSIGRLSVTATQCKLAYQVLLLNIGVCKAFTKIFSVLVASVRSDQVTVRARGLKSVTQMIEKDPSMLEQMASQVNILIGRCIGDSSSMVRDNALALLGKCMLQSTRLDEDMLRSVVGFTRDTAAGIKKRSIKLLKDLFLKDYRNLSAGTKEYKAIISDYLLQAIVDGEESVTEAARQTLEEMWLLPFEEISRNNAPSVQDRVALKEHVNLLTRTMNRNDAASVLARKFFRYSMSEKCKNAKINKRINKAFVSASFDVMLDSDPDAPSRISILQTMTVFAQAKPKLFTQQQLEHMFQPYIGTTIESGDVNMFRKVVIILRWVLPTLSSVQESFLLQVQGVFFKNVQRLPKQILNEVAACLWTISGSTQNLGNLTNLELSVLKKLRQNEAISFVDNPAEASKTQRYMDLAGQFGHFCDFTTKLGEFRSKLNWLRPPTVPGMIIAALRPFSSSKQPLTLRTSALDNIGLICEAWPQHFNDKEIKDLFAQVLEEDDPELQKIVLGCFRNFFATQDAQFGSEEEIEARQVLIDGKIGGSVIASDRDAAAALIAQGFVTHILKISLESQDDHALAATEVLGSILRQGLVHPKEIGPSLIALSTSQNSRIAQIALQQHETQHLQHESMFEREYMRAVTTAFEYQKRVLKNTRGFVKPSFRAKLHSTYEIIKTSKSKFQAKFLANYITRIDFDPLVLDVAGSELPRHLEISRFLLENLAFFDYVRLEDLMQVIHACEKIVVSTGASISDSINSEVLGMIIDPTSGVPMNLSIEGTEGQQQTSFQNISDSRLRLLTSSAIILYMTWRVRTFLRELYSVASTSTNGQSTKVYTGRGRPPKDANKISSKNAAITGGSLVDSIDILVSSLDSREASIDTCKEFSRLMAIDYEVKVPTEDANDANGVTMEMNEFDGKDTPTWRDRDMSVATTEDGEGNGLLGSARKRRGSSTVGNTPAKKKRGRPPKARPSEDRASSAGVGGFETTMFG